MIRALAAWMEVAGIASEASTLGVGADGSLFVGLGWMEAGISRRDPTTPTGYIPGVLRRLTRAWAMELEMAIAAPLR